MIASATRVPVYGVLWKDTSATARNWQQAHLHHPYAIIGVDPTGVTGIDLGLRGVPETFVLDEEGNVMFHIQGMISPDMANHAIIPILQAWQKERSDMHLY